MSFRHYPALAIAACVLLGSSTARAQEPAPGIEYKLLATSKTSTMEAEMRQAAGQGFRFAGVMGGETSFGGSEVVVVMTRADKPVRFDYRLLATSRTSTMQKELQAAGDAGFEYRGQTVFGTAFGGTEVVVILEREDREMTRPKHEYKLLAANKTSTLDKELANAGALGFAFVGLTVSRTAMGGTEVVAILRREAAR
jgi:hypothetical protein